MVVMVEIILTAVEIFLMTVVEIFLMTVVLGGGGNNFFVGWG